jgi:hypothetical protein
MRFARKLFGYKANSSALRERPRPARNASSCFPMNLKNMQEEQQLAKRANRHGRNPALEVRG